MRIAIDVDDVLVELMERWLAVYNGLYDTFFTKDQMLKWDLTKNGLQPMVYSVLSEYGEFIYGSAMPVDGAVQGVRLIEQAGYEVCFVTSAITHTVDAKVNWMEKFGFLKKGRSLDPKLVVTSNKNLVDADVLIDDKPENILRWPYPRKGLLFTQPWNSGDLLLPERAVRVDGWKGVLTELGLARGVYDRID